MMGDAMPGHADRFPPPSGVAEICARIAAAPWLLQRRQRQELAGEAGPFPAIAIDANHWSAVDVVQGVLRFGTAPFAGFLDSALKVRCAS